VKSKFEWFKYASKTLNCDYQQNSFLIDFVPRGHPFPQKLKYRYRRKIDGVPIVTKQTCFTLFAFWRICSK
jgi:hypothetical protein